VDRSGRAGRRVAGSLLSRRRRPRPRRDLSRRCRGARSRGPR
jgi:hypothetical protein